MALAEFEFRLWHWGAVLAVVLAATGWTMFLHSRPVDEAMRTAVRERLLHEYADQGSQAPGGAPDRSIEWRAFGAHGVAGSLTAVVRVEVRVDGAAPPDGRAVRYLRVYHNRPNRSWQVIGESSAWAYYSMWLP